VTAGAVQATLPVPVGAGVGDGEGWAEKVGLGAAVAVAEARGVGVTLPVAGRERDYAQQQKTTRAQRQSGDLPKRSSERTPTGKRELLPAARDRR
jgi:hypothetical protein